MLSLVASIQPARLRIAPPDRANTQDLFFINPLEVPKVVAATTMPYKCLLNIASAGCSCGAGRAGMLHKSGAVVDVCGRAVKPFGAGARSIPSVGLRRHFHCRVSLSPPLRGHRPVVLSS